MSDKKLVLNYYKNLKLDNTEMDTALAEVYLDKHNKTFKPIITKDDMLTLTTVLDNANNKIVCIDSRTTRDNTLEMFDKSILQNVSTVIRRNAELFAQLEFMIRGIPQKDVKKYDVNIMADQFEYASNSISCDGYYHSRLMHPLDYITLTEDLPLCILAQAAMHWARGATVYFETTKNTAAVCILFAELCFEAGIPKNKLYVEIFEDIFFSESMKNSSSIAVFTEHGDIESGVDVVFDVTTELVYPWRLRRAIVQENTYERFKRTIRSKVGSLNVRKLSNEEIVNKRELVDLSTYLPDLLEKSKDVLYYRNKLLAFDYAGCLDGDATHTRIVLVDTYRTTKELLCLMRRYQPRYLSLWCDQISTANEIVFGLDVPNVWLNDFGLFSGPGGVAETFLKRQDYDQGECNHLPEEYIELLKKWNTFSIKQRKSALESALIKIYDTGNHSLPEGKDFVINYVRTWDDTSSLSVRDGVLCQQVKLPLGVIQTCNLSDKFLDVIRALLIGNILCYCNEQMFNRVSLEIFSSCDVPIRQTNLFTDVFKILNRIGNNQFITYAYHTVTYMFITKTIWSSFGETFAN